MHKSQERLEAERAGYGVKWVPGGYKIVRGDNGPVPRDRILNGDIVFQREESAWLAASMFDLGMQYANRPA